MLTELEWTEAQIEVQAFWTTSYSPEVWAHLQKVGQPLASVEGESEPDSAEPPRALVLVHIPDASSALPLLAQATVIWESDPDTERSAIWWVLTVRRVPQSEPPALFREGDRKLRDQGGLLTLLKDCSLDRVEEVPMARYNVKARLRGNAWDCKMLPRVLSQDEVRATLGDLASEATLTEATYELGGGANGITRVQVAKKSDEEDSSYFEMKVLARGALRFDKEVWLPDGGAMFGLALSRLFSKRGGE